jgi:alkanesulfonate monooxygenase SsuD/methylene tetrahydromethanopterin reductase-like flavin-dependent oxidoreductase (luciferase family)
MHVGLGLAFQSFGGQAADHALWSEELGLAELAEPLGLESVWTVEHHFTDYAVSPDALQMLTWIGARTERIGLGTMVAVLPWHDPVRLAEQIATLDTLSGGRVILGIGRGLGRVEYEGFRIDMDSSRERFVEAAKIVVEGLETGRVQLDGKIFQQPERELRPPATATFRGRTYAAAISPESMRIMAELGVGMLIVPQKPWETLQSDLEEYRGIFREVHGAEPPAPIAAVWTVVDEDGDRADELGREWLHRYYHSLLEHYELAGSHFADTKGYDYYAKMSGHINRQGTDKAADFFADLHARGTPEQVRGKIEEIRALTGAESLITVPRFGGMDAAEAERNLRLFARSVMPSLQSLAPVAAS